MTGQSLLDICELLNQELQLQSGEVDVTRGLLALNVAQDYFESLASARPQILGSTTGTLSTAAGTETTAMPTGLLRIDKLQLLDSASRPSRDLQPLSRVGGHRRSSGWLASLASTTGGGAPTAYKNFGGLIYWEPLPDAVHVVRWSGFQAASDITAGGTFAYPDIVALPLASFAVQLLRLGVDDSVNDIGTLAQVTFSKALDTLDDVNRDGAQGLHYTSTHLE